MKNIAADNIHHCGLITADTEYKRLSEGRRKRQLGKSEMNHELLEPVFFLLCLGAKLLGALGVRLSQSSRHCNGCKSRQLVSVWTEADVDTRKPYSLEGG